MKTLILVRGLPGSGKTTFAELIAAPMGAQVYSADDFFMVEDKYCFDPNNLGKAHAYCQDRVLLGMLTNEATLIVANTFTIEKEMQPYFDMAANHGYKVFCIVVENRHGNPSIHAVPQETVEKMKGRFNIKL